MRVHVVDVPGPEAGVGERRAHRPDRPAAVGRLVGDAVRVARRPVAGDLGKDLRAAPPTINYRVPDPECDLHYVPNAPRTTRIRAAISNSFGFGGHNDCLLVREVPR